MNELISNGLLDDSDCRFDIGVLHLHFDSVVLLENAPGHASPSDPQHYRADVAQLVRLDFGQDADERSRRLFLHRVRVQCLVHHRNTISFHHLPQQVVVRSGFGQYYRLCGHALLLHRSDPATLRGAPRERRYLGILLHHPHHEALQVDAPLVRIEDSHTDVPRIRQGANSTRVLLNFRWVFIPYLRSS